MNADLKTAWVEALRSGKYKQTQKFLRVDGGYCCLGVLCDISGEGTWAQDPWSNSSGYSYEGEFDTERLTPSMLHAFEISNEDAEALMEMNDKEGLSFSSIADYIEDNL